jgi:heme/copper-type cytochrome/quinol oxidase subunit 4
MWGVIIGLGVAMALTPLCPLCVVVLLSLQNGARKAWAFFLGEFVVLAGIGALTVFVHLGTSRHSASKPASIVTLVVGIAMVVIGTSLVLRARRSGGSKEPSFMARLDRMEPWPAFLLGLLLPTYLIAVAAGAHIVGTHPGTATAIAAMVVFLAVGTSTSYVPIVLAEVAPERSGPARARLRDVLVRNWQLVGAALLLLVGVLLVAKGAFALS